MSDGRRPSAFTRMAQGVAGATLVASAAYGVRLWRQVRVLQGSLRRPRLFDDDFHSQRLGRYYYSFFPSYMQPETHPPEVDEQGVPVNDYTRKLLIRGVTGRTYNPLTVSHWVLGSYDDWLRTGERQHRELFLRRADWLVENQVVKGGVGWWYYAVPWGPPYQVKPPWASAMAQGFALSGLMRAHQETGEEVYRQAAQRALKSFEVGVEEGGITSTDEFGNVFYEEVPSQPPHHILNGHIFALFGLHDYCRSTGEARAGVLFEMGVEAVRNRLPDYDAGLWSKYSLNPKPNWRSHWNIAAPIYQQVHIDLLRFLHRITGDAVFDRWAARWEAQQRKPVGRLLEIAFVAFKDGVLVGKRLKGLGGRRR
jgi:heparosan-N-sulfate-glucuronate 5-epimerase